MKELARIMRFDLLTAAGTPGGMFLSLFLGGAGVLFGLLFFPVGSVYIMITVSGMLILPLWNAEEKNGFKKLYGVLPVNRRNITRARFLYILLVSFVSELFSFLIMEISFSAELYRLLPITAPDIKEMVEQSFNREQNFPLTVKVIVGAFLLITVIGGVFTMLSMIFGSEYIGRIIAVSVTVLVVICMAFVVLNEMDIVPVFDIKGTLTKVVSLPGIIILNLAAAAVCLICGEITAAKVAGREL